jgi:hypothetical protein
LLLQQWLPLCLRSLRRQYRTAAGNGSGSSSSSLWLKRSSSRLLWRQGWPDQRHLRASCSWLQQPLLLLLRLQGRLRQLLQACR